MIQTSLPDHAQSDGRSCRASSRSAGIDLQLEVVDHQTFHARIRKDEPGAVYHAAARFPVADALSAPVLPPADRRHPDRGDQLSAPRRRRQGEIDAAAIEPDAAKQKELWKVAQAEVTDDVPRRRSPTSSSR